MAGIDFKDDSDFTGEAKGYSLAAKLGFYLQVTMRSPSAASTDRRQPARPQGRRLQGEGFDMPPIVALGLAWQANERLIVAADVKDVMWGSSMNTVTIDTPAGYAVPFQQDWDDQIVLALGLSYKSTMPSLAASAKLR